MRKLGVVIGVVVVIAVIGWLALRGGGGGGGEDAATRAGSGAAGARGAAGAPERFARLDPSTVSRGSLAGTVTADDATRAPIARARVCARGASAPLDPELLRAPRCADTDERGRYELRDLLPARYTVSAAARTFRPSVHHPGGDRRKSTVEVRPGAHARDVDIALRPGGVEVTGTVADLTGGAIARAHVRAYAGRWNEDGPMAVTETDEDGRFALWMAPGPVRVVASADGYADDDEHVRAPGKVELLLTPESSLSGTVVDAATGEPVAGARVLVGTNEWGWDSGETVFSDAQGVFRRARLTPGRYVAVARTPNGYGRAEGSTLVGLGQHVDGVVVKLFPARRLEGTVIVATTKAPCPEPGVTLVDAAADRRAWTHADEQGRVWAEGVLPGKYTVEVWCRGFHARDQYEPVVVAGEDVTGLVWEVDPGATIRGRVVAKSDGAPIEGADVWARTVGGAARSKTGWSTDTSGRDGGYELVGLRPGAYRLEVTTDKGLAPADGYRVTIAANAVVEQDLAVEDGGTVQGTIADADGKPVAGVAVHARAQTSRWTWSGEDIKSDDAGAFTIPSLRAGEYRIAAQRGWSAELRKPGTTDDAQQGEKATVRAGQVTTVRLVVETQSGTIKGTVVDAGGTPVADAFVTAARESDAAGARNSSVANTRWSWDDKPVLTSTEGAFALTKLSPGTYTVRAYRRGGGEAIAEHVALGATARLQIKPTGSIEGVARIAGGGAPEDLTVELHDRASGVRRREQLYRTDGRFALRDLPEGRFRLTASGAGAERELEVALAEGEAKTGVVVELEPLVTIAGRVVDLVTKQPVAGMMMSASPASGGGRMMFRSDDAQDHVTDEAGAFTIKRAPRGKVSLRGFPKDWDDSVYGFIAVVRDVSGAGTVDVGDVGVIKKRVKQDDVVGEHGLRFAEHPHDAPPDQYKLEVSWIDPAGPAAKTELRVGDVITTIDGVEVGGTNSSHAWVLMRAPPGTALALGLARGATVTVVLAAP